MKIVKDTGITEQILKYHSVYIQLRPHIEKTPDNLSRLPTCRRNCVCHIHRVLKTFLEWASLDLSCQSYLSRSRGFKRRNRIMIHWNFYDCTEFCLKNNTFSVRNLFRLFCKR